MYRENRLIPDGEALLQPDKSWTGPDQNWWRRYCLGWIARLYTAEAGSGSAAQIVQSLLHAGSRFAAFDATILFADIANRLGTKASTALYRLVDQIGHMPAAVQYDIARHLSGWLLPAQRSSFQIYLDTLPAGCDPAAVAALWDMHQKSADQTAVPNDQDSLNDGWPVRPPEVHTGWSAILSAVDYGSIYSIPQLVQMGLYDPDRTTAARSLYALVDHGQKGITGGQHEERAIRQLLLSPYGPGFVRRIGSPLNLLRRLSKYLTYQRVSRDAVWAEACSILCRNTAYPILPLPAGDMRLINAASTPPEHQWVYPQITFCEASK